jgi:acyl-CoA synthetase (NDP forming)
MADIEVADVLRYFRDDPDTKVVGLYLEAYGQHTRFASAISALAEQKPVVAARVGHTIAGGRASRAHIGAAHPPWKVPLPDQSRDVIPAQTGQELLHFAKALCWQPCPRGPRAAIITGSGGIGAELVDLAIGEGLGVPELTSSLQVRLKGHLPSYAACGNPVDLTPMWTEYPRIYPPLIHALVASDEIDLVIMTVIDVATGVDDLMEALCNLRHDETIATARKPIYVYWNSLQANLPNMARLQTAGLPCYQSTVDTVRVAAASARHAAIRLRRPVR